MTFKVGDFVDTPYGKAKVTLTGYRNSSPDKCNALNLIPSNKISMKGVLFPVLGVDNLGNIFLMQPEQEYVFTGTYVIERPMTDNLQYLNQTGQPTSTGGLSCGAWGAIGSASSALMNGVAGIVESGANNKANQRIASGQNSTAQTIAGWDNQTIRCVCAAHDATALKVAQIEAAATRNKPVTLLSSSSVTMVFAGVILLGATIGIFIYASKNKS